MLVFALKILKFCLKTFCILYKILYVFISLVLKLDRGGSLPALPA